MRVKSEVSGTYCHLGKVESLETFYQRSQALVVKEGIKKTILVLLVFFVSELRGLHFYTSLRVLILH